MAPCDPGGGVLRRAGLPEADVAAWEASRPNGRGAFGAAADAVSTFLTGGRALIGRLPAKAVCTDGEQAARDAITHLMNHARENFLRSHAADLYDAVTGRCTRPLRLEEFAAAAAAHVPGLVPGPAEMDAERARMLRDKEGAEFAQGLLFAYVLAVPRAGRHLIGAMLRPTPLALGRLGELRACGTVDLGPVRVTRRGRA